MNKFKAMITNKLGNKVTAKYSEFENLLIVEKIPGTEPFTPSEQALFDEVMAQTATPTNIGVVTGNDQFPVRNAFGDGKTGYRARENIIGGSWGEDIQMLDLDDIEAFDNIPKSESGLGVSTAGTMGHEIGEGNFYQQNKGAPFDQFGGDGMIKNKAHEYGIGVENKINGTNRLADPNLQQTRDKGSEYLRTGFGETLFFDMFINYLLNGMLHQVIYPVNRSNVEGTSKPPAETKTDPKVEGK
jgi:hypothetical protein